jgi:hypothetical protein
MDYMINFLDLTTENMQLNNHSQINNINVI